jgi:hypothetical protein
MILRYPWLHDYNPWIDWKEGKIKGELLHITTANNDYRYTLAKKLAEVVEINKASISQEWANHEKHHQEEVVIPEEYKQHKVVFQRKGPNTFPQCNLKTWRSNWKQMPQKLSTARHIL